MRRHAWVVVLVICGPTLTRGQTLSLPAEQPPPCAVVETLPAEAAVVEASRRFGGFELGVFRIRVAPAGSSPTAATDYRDDVVLRFATGRFRPDEWSTYFEYSGINSELKDGLFNPTSGDFVGLVRELHVNVFEWAVRTPRVEWGGLGTAGELALGVPVVDLEQRLAENLKSVPRLTDSRQEFVGGGAKAGWLLDLPVCDPVVLNARLDAGGYWGSFSTKQDLSHLNNPVDVSFRTYQQGKGGLLCLLSGEAGVTYGVEFKKSLCLVSAGYRYEMWYSKDLWTYGPMSERKARVEAGGPFLRLEVQY